MAFSIEKTHSSRWSTALVAGSLFALFMALLPFATKEQGGLLQPVGEVTIINGNASGLARHGDYLYMVMNESTRPLLVYDIHDPSHPKLLHYLPAPGWPMRCRIVGERWLWTVHGNGEGFFDLTDPANPRFAEGESGPPLKFVDRRRFKVHPNFTYQTCAYDMTLYYGTEQNETEIHDISDPKAPKLLSTIPSGVPTLLQGNLLFVAGSKSPVQIFDVHDPSAPKLLGQLGSDEIAPLVKEGFSLRGSAIAYDNKGRLFVGIQRDLRNFLGVAPGPYERAQTGIAVFDIRDFRSPQLLGWITVSKFVSDITTLAYYKGHVFASDAAFGLRVFDVHDPQNIRQVAADRQGGELSAVALMPKRRLLLVGQNITGGVVVVDVAKPQKPQVLSYIHLAPLRVWGTMATYQDRYLYFQADFSRPRPGLSVLCAVDLQNPRQPKIASILPNVGRAYGTVIVDRYLYTSGGDIFDLTDPASPKRLMVRLPCEGYQIAHREPYLFVAHFAGEGNSKGEQQGALYVVDIHQREKPALVGKTLLPMAHRVITMAFLNDFLFLGWAERAGGRRPRGVVYALNITDPKNPRIVRRWDVVTDLGMAETINYCHVWTDGQFLFIGCYRRKLGMYQVRSDSGSVTLKNLAMLDGLPSGWLMTGEPGFLYRICLDGMKVISVTKPSGR